MISSLPTADTSTGSAIGLPLIVAVLVLAAAISIVIRNDRPDPIADPTAEEIEAALGRYILWRWIRRAALAFAGAGLLWILWDATHGATESLQAIPVLLAVVMVGAWWGPTHATKLCQQVHVADPAAYLRDSTRPTNH